MKKLLLILLLFVGGLFTTTTVYAEKPSNESWLLYGAKTMWKSDTNFSVGVGSGVYCQYGETLKIFPNTNPIHLEVKYKNIYLGFFNTRYKENKLNYFDYQVYYVGYGINFGNVYEIAHKADNTPHKILKHINFVPIIDKQRIIKVYSNEHHAGKEKYDLGFHFGHIIDVDLFNYKGFGMNVQYTTILTRNTRSTTNAHPSMNYATINLKYCF